MSPVQVISFKCILKDKIGHLISSTFNREVINSLDIQGSQLAGLVEGLQDLKKGEKRLLELSAEKAYGFYDPKKIIFFPRKKIPKEVSLRVGETLIITSKSGKKNTYRIHQILPDLLQLDGNHPLAGQDLVFEIEATEVRKATAEEIESASNPISNQYLH